MDGLYGTSGIGSNAASKERAQSFVDPLDSAERQLNDLTARLLNMADRLCGSVPQNASGGSVPTAVPNGVFEGIANTGRNMVATMEIARNALGRIESSLP